MYENSAKSSDAILQKFSIVSYSFNNSQILSLKLFVPYFIDLLDLHAMIMFTRTGMVQIAFLQFTSSIECHPLVFPGDLPPQK